MSLPNYHLYRSDRIPSPRKPTSGGTAIFVRRNIIHHQIAIPISLDSTTVQIKLDNDIVQITAAYKSPRDKLKRSDLNALTNHNGPFIIAGDLNAKHTVWNSRLINTAGTTALHHMEETNLYTITAPDTPTYYPHNAAHLPDVLDITLLNISPRQYTIDNINDLSSDHNQIIITINSSLVTYSMPKQSNKINWKKFTREIADKIQIPHIRTSNDIEHEIDKLTQIIQQTINESSTSPHQTRTHSSLTDEILLEIATKRHLRKEWQTKRNPQTKRLYNSQIKYVRNLLQTHRKKAWDDFTATLNFKDKSIYKLSNRLLHKAPARTPMEIKFTMSTRKQNSSQIQWRNSSITIPAKTHLK